MTVVTKTDEKVLALTDSEMSEGVDVEQKIVNELMQFHKLFIQEKS